MEEKPSNTGTHLDLVNQALAESLKFQREAIEVAKAEERASLQKIEELVRLQGLKEQANALEQQRISAEQDTKQEYTRFIEAENKTHQTITRLVSSVEKMLENTGKLISTLEDGRGLAGDVKRQGIDLSALLSVIGLVSNNVLLILEIQRMQLAHMDSIMNGFNIQLSKRDSELRERLLSTIGHAVSRGDVNISSRAVGSVNAETANVVDGKQELNR